MQYNNVLLIQKIAYDMCSKYCSFFFTHAVHLETVNVFDTSSFIELSLQLPQILATWGNCIRKLFFGFSFNIDIVRTSESASQMWLSRNPSARKAYLLCSPYTGQSINDTTNKRYEGENDEKTQFWILLTLICNSKCPPH